MKCPVKSQNVRRGTHDSLVKMSGEAQNHFAYSDYLMIIGHCHYHFKALINLISALNAYFRVCLQMAIHFSCKRRQLQKATLISHGLVIFVNKKALAGYSLVIHFLLIPDSRGS